MGESCCKNSDGTVNFHLKVHQNHTISKDKGYTTTLCQVPAFGTDILEVHTTFMLARQVIQSIMRGENWLLIDFALLAIDKQFRIKNLDQKCVTVSQCCFMKIIHEASIFKIRALEFDQLFHYWELTGFVKESACFWGCFMCEAFVCELGWADGVKFSMRAINMIKRDTQIGPEATVCICVSVKHPF